MTCFKASPVLDSQDLILGVRPIYLYILGINHPTLQDWGLVGEELKKPPLPLGEEALQPIATKLVVLVLVDSRFPLDAPYLQIILQ
jgi:hypothetical protein